MTVEPTREDAELRERTLRDLRSVTADWSRFQVVRPYGSERQREVDHEILTEHGYNSVRFTASPPTLTYENPAEKESKASLDDELARSTNDWTTPRPIRQFEDSAAGRARLDDTTAIMREHSYEPGVRIHDGQGRINVTYLRAEVLAFQNRYGPPSSLIGLPKAQETFECVECGRWAEVLSSAEVYTRLIQTELGFNLTDWSRVRSAARPTSPLRPAFLQREFGDDYDKAVTIIDAAVQLGMLKVGRRGVVAGQPRCAVCLERRAATPEPVASAQRSVTRSLRSCASGSSSVMASVASTADAPCGMARPFISTMSCRSRRAAKPPRTT